MRWRLLIAGCVAFAGVAETARADGAAITILFHVRPPYAEFDAQHQVTGLLVAPVKAALERGGLTADWIETPPVRQTEDIKRGDRPVCGLGWFKRPEREAFAHFTQPIYQDQPAIVVAREDDARFTDGVSLQDSFRDTARSLIVKSGYSYGATIDAWIKELQPRTETSANDNETLLGIVAMKRADYAIMAPEEAETLFAALPELGDPLRAVRLIDAPKGELRYLMCSKATPPEIIARINAGLPALPMP